SPGARQEQTGTSQAKAAPANEMLGILRGTTTTTLSYTGTLSGTNDARDASALSGNIPSLLTVDVLHATTIGYPDEVDSEASLADLGLTVAGTGISADFVMARALAVLGAIGSGGSSIANLSINGVPFVVSGDANQTIAIPGGQVVVNEQQTDPSGTITVNALHVTISGVAN